MFRQMTTALVLVLFTVLTGQADDRTSMFGIRGEVSQARLESADGEDSFTLWVVDFDEDGQIVAVNDAEPRITRDARGLVTEIITVEEDEDGQPVDIVTRLTYNDKPRVVAAETLTDEDRWTFTYKYDDKGHMTERTYHSNGDREVFAVTYPAADDADGNWTERNETADGAEYPVVQRLKLTRRP